jgi:Rap1a immunity proteins
MKPSLLAAATLQLMATTPQAPVHAAGGVDGQMLYSHCRDSSSFCMGYVRASADWANLMLTGICVPQTAVAQTLADVITLWLATHPEQRTHHGTEVVTTALAEAYPCKKAP